MNGVAKGRAGLVTLFGAAANSAGLEAACHTVVHRLGRHYGFQAFNVIPGTEGLPTEQWSPATIFVVTDHLHHLLVRNAFRRDKLPGSEVEVFARCVRRLHSTVMEGYGDWCAHVGLPERVVEVEYHTLNATLPVAEWEFMLEELALYFLLYTEAANLRHLPEALWFLYWVLRNSRDTITQVCCPPPDSPQSAAYIANDESMRGLANRRIALRNEFSAEVGNIRDTLNIPDGGAHHSTGDIAAMHAAALQRIAALRTMAGRGTDAELVAEMIVYGDCGAFLDKVVGPIFAYLTAQIDKLGGSGCEIGSRMGYDDCNESFNRPELVAAALQELGVKVDAHHLRVAFSRDPLLALLAIGYPVAEPPKGRRAKKAAAQGKDLLLMQAELHGPAEWDVTTARNWYAKHVFRKTFIEARSPFMPYRAFFRVFAFHILAFQFMASLAWSNGDWWIASITVLTHAALSLLDQWAAVWTQRYIGEHDVKLAGHPLWGRHLPGLLCWAAINAGMWFCFVTWFLNWTRVIWVLAAGIYAGLIVFRAVISTRSGYAVSMTHQVSKASRRTARKRFTPGWFFYAIAWLFEVIGVSSPRPEPAKEYLQPTHMKVDFAQSAANLLFWVILLGIKLAFDWFAVIKPMKGPLGALRQRKWLNTGHGDIFINGQNTRIPYPDGDILLCIARALPGFLLTLVDTGIFYSLVSAVFGAAKGLFVLNLGVVSSFGELRSNFHKGPGQWWNRCMSAAGNANIARAVDAAGKPGHVAGIDGAPVMRPPPPPAPRGLRLTPGARTGPGGGAIGGGGRKGSGVGAGAQLQELTRQPQAQRNRRLGTTLPAVLKGRQGRDVLKSLSNDRVAMWVVFSDIWNAIVDELRGVDLISDDERANLRFIHLDIDDSIEGMRPFMLPVFFYAGQVNQACEVPGLSSSQIVALSELRSLLAYILLQLGILNRGQANAVLEFVPVKEPRSSEHRNKRTSGLKLVITLLEQLEELAKQLPTGGPVWGRATATSALRDTLLKLCEMMSYELEEVKDRHRVPTRDTNDPVWSHQKHARALRLETALGQLQEGLLRPTAWSNFVSLGSPLSAIYHEAPPTKAKEIMMQAAKQLLKLLKTAPGGTAPHGAEAQRILSFFLSSLTNPTLDAPPAVPDMLGFNTLTPHYEEDVIYALSAEDVAQKLGLPGEGAGKGLTDLLTENEDGVAVITYMRSIYPDDWRNFLQRLKPKFGLPLDLGSVSEDDFRSDGPLHHLQSELQLWASYRGQLLARTVRGMMAYEDALKLLAFVENPKPGDMSEEDYDRWLDDLVTSKFTYVVASQVYGKNRSSTNAKGRWLARGIELLLFQYPNLRVAYMDNVGTFPELRQYAVLMRGTGFEPQGTNSATEEVYRVRLPQNRDTGRGVVLGEGKPENQNAAVIFCFNEVLQAIDMNQDNYLAEGLKMRNLVSEFHPDSLRHKDGTVELPPDVSVNVPAVGSKERKARRAQRAAARGADQTVALVGFREWIFSENSGALAGFAAATEFTFGTIVQRVMSWPGGVRFHYGHPDLWNKLYIMSRGGVSKATRGFHISEDVFAGYNYTLRGARTKFKEYVSVGKGRDMGFDSINSFESKVAGGNGEQVLSRDVFRLGTKFDFMRLMSWYHTGPGFFINSYLIFLTIMATIWVYLLLALTNSQTYACGPDNSQTCSTITGTSVAYAAGQVVQVGFLTIITYAVELLLERGIVFTAATILVQALQGSILFGVFRSRTSAFYFKQDMKYGGASYIPTGRGYALQHNTFVKVYTSYARSHMYYAVQLMMLLVLLAIVGSQHYISTTWGAWLVAVAMLYAPFWFNPQGFSMTKTKADFDAWWLWMSDVMDPSTKTTWYSWNKGSLEKSRNEKRTLTHPHMTAFFGILETLPIVILTVASISILENTRFNKYAMFGVVTGILWSYLGLVALVRHLILRRYMQRTWRIARIFFTAIGIAGVVVFAVVIIPDVGAAADGVRNVAVIAFANFQIVVLAVQIAMLCFPESPNLRYYVDWAYRGLDWGIGYCLFSLLFIFSFVGFVNRIQASLLFNIEFSKSLKRGRLLGNYLKLQKQRLLRENERQAALRQSSTPPFERHESDTSVGSAAQAAGLMPGGNSGAGLPPAVAEAASPGGPLGYPTGHQQGPSSSFGPLL